MRIHVHTRFSIADHLFKGFILTRNTDEKDYLLTLFSKERLAVKFAAFETFTLPSILSQTWNDWEWHIYISLGAPADFKARLNSLVSVDSRIHVQEVSSMKQVADISTQLDSQAPLLIGSMRLDDDDALHPSIFQRLQNFACEPKGTVVGLIGGVLSDLVDGVPRASTKPFGRHPYVIALGMTRIGDNVFAVGNHYTAHVRHPCCYIFAEEGMIPFLCFANEHTDTARKNEIEFMKPIDMKQFLS